MSYDEETQNWQAELKSDYPRVITDDKVFGEPTIKFIPISNIGKILLDRNLNVIEATPRSVCGEGIRNRLDLWKESAERIMVEASSEQLARLRGADQVLYPIVVIVDNLMRPMSGVPMIANDDVQSDDDPVKLLKYLDLLAELQLVKATSEGWVEGPLFTPLLTESSKRRANFTSAILSHVLKQRYSAVRDIFHISRFERYVHADNCYYWYALDAGKLVNTERKKLFSRFEYYYGEVGGMSLNTIYNELSDVGALHMENNYCVGDKAIFDEMLDLRDQAAQVGTLKA